MKRSLHHGDARSLTRPKHCTEVPHFPQSHEIIPTVDHGELCDLADKYFGGLRTELDEDMKGSDAVCNDVGVFVGSDVR